MKLKSSLSLIALTGILFLTAPLGEAVIFAAEPTLQTQSFTATPGSGCSEIDLSFVWGNGSRRIIIACADTNVSSLPQDGDGYTASSLFGSGANLGNNNFVVYSGAIATSVTVTGLAGGTEYHFAIFEFNGSGNNADYLLTDYLQAHEIAPGFTISVSSSSGDMCSGDSVRLEAHGAQTYNWNPSGSLSSETDSVVWATPNNTTQYVVTGDDNSGCSDTKSVTITVYQTPNVSLGNFNNRCINGAVVTLSSGSPSGGTYSGTGVSGNHFDPSVAGVGSHVITYTYSDIHGCGDFDTSSIKVLNAPTATFSSLGDVCANTPSFPLSGGSPSGGTYSGSGVSSGQFNPGNVGVGQYQIRYIYSDGSGCSDTAYSNQKVRALPTVNFATLQPACLNTPTFALTGGTPSGGFYTGTGVNNSQFSPLVSGAGTFLINYSYTDSFNCSSQDTSVQTVHTLPAVSFNPLSPRCQNTGPLTLSGGSPIGGSYSGPGVGNGVFYSAIAGAGQHTITYTYSNAFGCSNATTQVITVNPLPYPNLGSDIIVCSNEFAHLFAGNFSTYSWSTGSHASSINVDTTGHGLGVFPFSIIVTNSFGCVNKDTILVTFDGCVGMEKIIPNDQNVSVFPNPFSNQFSVLSEQGNDLSLYDIKGTLIMEIKDAPSVITYGENLPAGSYILRIRKNQSSIYRLIIKN
jgi:hypothetical protein